MGNSILGDSKTFTITCEFSSQRDGIHRNVIIKENHNPILPLQIWNELITEINTIPNEADPFEVIRIKAGWLHNVLKLSGLFFIIGFLGGFILSIAGCPSGMNGVCIGGIICWCFVGLVFFGLPIAGCMENNIIKKYEDLCAVKLLAKGSMFQQKYIGIAFTVTRHKITGKITGNIYINPNFQANVVVQQPVVVIPNYNVNPVMPSGPMQYNNMNQNNNMQQYPMYNNNMNQNNNMQQYPMYNNNNMQHPNYSGQNLQQPIASAPIQQQWQPQIQQQQQQQQPTASAPVQQQWQPQIHQQQQPTSSATVGQQWQPQIQQQQEGEIEGK